MNDVLSHMLTNGVAVIVNKPGCVNVVKAATTEVLSTMCREIKARQIKVGTVNNEVQDPQ